ncbi:hypothetical protein [Curtobacterium sp. MCSS17_016]|uniref:hypothetical protein n=1 Tax=Curtobacterium sp. MCSS17_016 TaxID=2175644 RepID=UPI000DAACE19|nr:hypothetical protein [Curtobacterium sp. MCSS17_016]WIE81049.1 hypothetical protein DEJ19_021265 [Curtobacterium sp. MCSS17_016]
MTTIDDFNLDDLFEALTTRIQNETGRPFYKEHNERYFFEQGVRAGLGLQFTMADRTDGDGKPVNRASYTLPPAPLPDRFEREPSPVADIAEAVTVTEGQRKALELVNEGQVAEKVGYGDKPSFHCVPTGGRRGPQDRTLEALYTAGLVVTSNRTHQYGGWVIDLTPRGHATLTAAAKPDLAKTLTKAQHKALHLVGTDTIYIDGFGTYNQDWRKQHIEKRMPLYPTFAELENANLITRDRDAASGDSRIEKRTPVRLTDTGRALLTEKGPHRGL